MFFLDNCNGLGPVVTIVHKVVNIIRFAVPILLIMLGTLDLAKAVIAGKEEEMKKAQKTLIMRAVYAVAVFLVVTLVIFIMGLLPADQTAGTNWQQCWEEN